MTAGDFFSVFNDLAASSSGVSIRERFGWRGIGHAALWPLSIVKTFDDYRSIIPRWKPLTNELLEELQREHLVLAYGRVENLIMNTGKAQISRLCTGVSDTYFTHCAIGSGTTTPDVGDANLTTTQGARVAVTDAYLSGNDMKFDTLFNDSHGANGTTVNETGLFTGVTDGLIINHSLISPGLSKASTNTLTISITGTLT